MDQDKNQSLPPALQQLVVCETEAAIVQRMDRWLVEEEVSSSSSRNG